MTVVFAHNGSEKAHHVFYRSVHRCSENEQHRIPKPSEATL